MGWEIRKFHIFLKVYIYVLLKLTCNVSKTRRYKILSIICSAICSVIFPPSDTGSQGCSYFPTYFVETNIREMSDFEPRERLTVHNAKTDISKQDRESRLSVRDLQYAHTFPFVQIVQ